MTIRQQLIDVAIFVTSACNAYLLWILLHFVASHIYVRYCVGSNWYDIFLSVIYVSSPYCQGISWIIYTGSKQIVSMWMVFGTYASTKLLQNMFKKDC